MAVRRIYTDESHRMNEVRDFVVHTQFTHEFFITFAAGAAALPIQLPANTTLDANDFATMAVQELP